MRSDMEVPACIHDDFHATLERTTEEASTGLLRVRRATRCEGCGALLYTSEGPVGGPHHQLVMDDVYETLYTRKGRLALVIAALEEMEWPIPEGWEKQEGGLCA